MRWFFWIGLVTVTLLPASLSAVEIVSNHYLQMHSAGGRLGIWTSTGDKTTVDSDGDRFEPSKSSFYGEFFYAHRLAPSFAAEISIAIFSRGDFKYLTREDVLLGSVNIYPVFLTGKLYPLAQLQNISIHPYFQFGGGIVHASRSGIDYYYGVEFTDESETELTYTLGGGLDFPVAEQICLLANFKYLPVKFSNPLVGIKDYSGWQLSVGLAYTFRSKRR
jgi:hypothetical protein